MSWCLILPVKPYVLIPKNIAVTSDTERLFWTSCGWNESPMGDPFWWRTTVPLVDFIENVYHQENQQTCVASDVSGSRRRHRFRHPFRYCSQRSPGMNRLVVSTSPPCHLEIQKQPIYQNMFQPRYCEFILLPRRYVLVCKKSKILCFQPGISADWWTKEPKRKHGECQQFHSFEIIRLSQQFLKNPK